MSSASFSVRRIAATALAAGALVGAAALQRRDRFDAGRLSALAALGVEWAASYPIE
ncbi:hypothetical protein ACIGQE_20980 [Streptomyces sp. NPDC053429]|uniref:hypothetical protein n=1 Tax=Streptomyces sp. NPDC053429 TaxID=3365702 RepID=UPI0037D5C146